MDIYRDKVSPGHVLLYKLPAHPRAYISAYDSIVAWLFQPVKIAPRQLNLYPASVYSGKGIPAGTIKKNDSFEISAATQRIIQTHNRPNRVGNVASGALSGITGVGFGKSKSADYRAIFPFVAGSDTINCVID